MNKASAQLSTSPLRALFRDELAAEIPNIQQQLLEISKSEKEIEGLDRLSELTMKIIGTAKIAKLDPAASLARSIDGFIDSAMENSELLTSLQIDNLNHAFSKLEVLANLGVSNTELPPEILLECQNVAADLQGFSKRKNGKQVEKRRKNKSSAPIVNGGKVSIREMFLTELECKLSELSDDILSIESGHATSKRLNGMMRAAHTIKGGARLSNVFPVVDTAHAMEDIFVAAQSRELLLNSDHCDVLFRAIDLIRNTASIYSESSENSDDNDLLDTLQQEEIAELKKDLAHILDGTFVADAKGPTSNRSANPMKPLFTVEDEEVLSDGGRILRIDSKSMDKIIGISGELTVELKQLNVISNAFMSSRRLLNELETAISSCAEIANDDVGFSVKRRINEIAQKHRALDNKIKDAAEVFGLHESYAIKLTKKMHRNVLSHRMRPFSEGVKGLNRLVRDLASSLGKEAELLINGESTKVDQDILEALKAPLTHIIQNAMDHGIESASERRENNKNPVGKIQLSAYHNGGMLIISISDDGRGINKDELRKAIADKELAPGSMIDSMRDLELFDFLLLPNFTLKQDVSKVSGRGMGLDILQGMLKKVRGKIHITSEPRQGTHIELMLPLTLSVVRCLVFSISGSVFALPVARVLKVMDLSTKNIRTLENKQFFMDSNGQNIGIVRGHQVLNLPEPVETQDRVILVGNPAKPYAIAIDKLEGEEELIVRPLPPELGKVKDVSSAAVLEDRRPALILDVDDLINSIDRLVSSNNLLKLRQDKFAGQSKEGKRVLVVDDSLTVREVERNLLEMAGYQVEVAVDGMDGWNAVRLRNFDLVITDVDMPRMDGIELTKLIRKDARTSNIPVVIISYKDREQDRLRGLEAGADHYLTKGSFEDESFSDAVRDLIGEADS